ncbi:MAG: hypothetical protein V3W41_03980 [Planctomycetota bacterium]
MRLLISVLLGTLVAATLASGQFDAASLEKKYRDKTAEPWVSKIAWERRILAARKKARSEGKLILAYFCCSYQESPACEVFEAGALLTDWWAEVAKDFVPYLNISARLGDKPDQGLLLDKGGRYFPYFIIMDEAGLLLVELRPINRKRVEQALADARLKQRLSRDAESGENIAAVRGLRLLKIILREEAAENKEEVERLAKTKGLDKILLGRLEEYRAIVQVQDVFDKAQEDLRFADVGDDAKSRAAVRAVKLRIAKGMCELLAKKVEFQVESNPGLYLNYAIFATKGAIAKKDAALGKRGLEMIQRGEAAAVPKKDHAKFRRSIGFSDLKSQVEALPKKG